MKKLKISRFAVILSLFLVCFNNVNAQDEEGLYKIIDQLRKELVQRDETIKKRNILIAELRANGNSNEETISKLLKENTKLKNENVALKQVIKYQQDELIRRFGINIVGVFKNSKEKPLGILKNQIQKAKVLEKIQIKLTSHSSDDRVLRAELFYAGNSLEKTSFSDSKHLKKGALDFEFNVNKSLKSGNYVIKIYDNENEIARKTIQLK